MPRHKALEPTTAPAEQSLRDFYAAHGVLEHGYLSTATAARFLDLPSPEAFLKWAKRRQVKLHRDGRRRLVLAESLRAELKG